MSHLLEVRKSALRRETDSVFKTITDLELKRSELFKTYQDNNDQSIADSIKTLSMELMKSQVKNYELIAKMAVYSDTNGIDLNIDNIDETKHNLKELLDLAITGDKNDEIDGAAESFVKSIVSCSTDDPYYDTVVLSFSKIGYCAIINECSKILNILDQAEEGRLLLDCGNKITTVDSCVKTMQGYGVPMTQLEFVDIINKSVWSYDEENELSSIVKIEENDGNSKNVEGV